MNIPIEEAEQEVFIFTGATAESDLLRHIREAGGPVVVSFSPADEMRRPIQAAYILAKAPENGAPNA